jgi:hypothetical protein
MRSRLTMNSAQQGACTCLGTGPNSVPNASIHACSCIPFNSLLPPSMTCDMPTCRSRIENPRFAWGNTCDSSKESLNSSLLLGVTSFALRSCGFLHEQYPCYGIAVANECDLLQPALQTLSASVGYTLSWNAPQQGLVKFKGHTLVVATIPPMCSQKSRASRNPRAPSCNEGLQRGPLPIAAT